MKSRFILFNRAGACYSEDNRKAAHRAHAKRALMRIPALEDYERKAGGTPIAGVA